MGAYNAAMDGTLGGNGNFLCRRATCANVCFPRVIIPSACTYDESKLVLTKNRPISYIKILTWLRGEGGGGGGVGEEWGKRGVIYSSTRFPLFYSLKHRSQVRISISRNLPIYVAIQMVSLNSQFPRFKRLKRK